MCNANTNVYNLVLKCVMCIEYGEMALIRLGYLHLLLSRVSSSKSDNVASMCKKRGDGLNQQCWIEQICHNLGI